MSTFTLQRESLSSCSLAEPAHSITSQTEWQAGRQAESLGLSVFLGYLSPLGAFAFACLPVCLCACNEPASNTASAAAAVRKIRLALLTAHCHLMHFNLYFNIPPCKSDSQQCVRCCASGDCIQPTLTVQQPFWLLLTLSTVADGRPLLAVSVPTTCHYYHLHFCLLRCCRRCCTRTHCAHLEWSLFCCSKHHWHNNKTARLLLLHQLTSEAMCALETVLAKKQN